MQAAILIFGAVALVVALLTFSAQYDVYAQKQAGATYGAAAGVAIAGARESGMLAERLARTRWRPAVRIGINPGRYVLDSAGLHWFPSFLTARRVPAFSIAWPEVARHHVKPGPKLIGRRVAYLDLSLTDGTALQFATFDPEGLAEVLDRLRL